MGRRWVYLRPPCCFPAFPVSEKRVYCARHMDLSCAHKEPAHRAQSEFRSSNEKREQERQSAGRFAWQRKSTAQSDEEELWPVKVTNRSGCQAKRARTTSLIRCTHGQRPVRSKLDSQRERSMVAQSVRQSVKRQDERCSARETVQMFGSFFDV